jgi:cell wall-associated NlpC family hydrolase
MWYNKYLGIPFKHLGQSPDTGLDCYTLCKHIIRAEKGIQLPYTSYEICNIADDDWYLKTNSQLLLDVVNSDTRCVKVLYPQPFDIVLLTIGSSNVVNHCALYVGSDKIIQTMIDRPSWVSSYGKYYKQYTAGIYRWISKN